MKLDDVKKCIADVSTKESFAQWLTERGDGYAGIQGEIHGCPIANFLKSKCGDGVNLAVTGRDIEIYTDEGSAKMSIGDWAEQFVTDIDSVRGRGIMAKVSGTEALKVLNKDDGWQRVLEEEVTQ